MRHTAAIALLAFVALIPFSTAAYQAAPAPRTPRAAAPAAQRPAATPAGKPDAARLQNLGVAYMNQQRLEKALELFRQAYAADPAMKSALLNQGIALLNLQRNQEALPLLEAAAREMPENPRVWFNLGLLHRNAGEVPQAVEALRKVAALDPNDPDTHYFLGVLQSQSQQYSEAIASFERAIALRPTHVSAEFGLARALQRTGRAAEARQHLDRFEQLNQSKAGAPISLIYGEQGQYSTVQGLTYAAQDAPPAIPVRFTPVALASVEKVAAGALPVDPPTPQQADIERLGPGACFLDFNGDGRQDLLLGRSVGGFVLLQNAAAKAAPQSPRRVPAASRPGAAFVEVSSKSGLRAAGAALGCAVADYDNDGLPDVALGTATSVALFRNSGKGVFVDVTAKAGITTRLAVLGITFVDYDHDGDADLYLSARAESGRNELWRNNGNGTFTESAEPLKLADSGPNTGAVLTDFNNDRAVDLVITGARTRILVNPREGAFREFEPWTGPESKAPPDTVGVAVADFDKDGWMDLAFTHGGLGGISVWRNLESKAFRPVYLSPPCSGEGYGLAAFDYDNDGWLDLLYSSNCDERSELRLLRNLGPKGFVDASESAGLERIPVEDPRAILTADYDLDGDLDLLITQAERRPLLLRNDGGNRHHSLRLALRGLADNKSAIGARVEVFAGSQWQKYEVQSASGYLGQSALPVLAGLGEHASADVVRLLWPTGVLQDEIEMAAGRAHTVDAIDRRGSSCPVLFAWNGSRYEFITDVIGAGIVGHWVAPGERNVADPDEYVKIEGSSLQPRDGLLSLRLVEPMEEVVFLDQVRLLAVDRPASLQVYPNEYFAAVPPFPGFAVVPSARPQLPAAAQLDGRDVLPELRLADRRYAGPLRPTPYKGFTQLSLLELELPQPYQGGPLRLLMRGFTDYFTATSVYAAHQGGVTAQVPYLEAQLPDGTWQRASDNIGFPAGLLRTMTADLAGKLPAGTRRIRIGTNLKIHWDQLLFDSTPAEAAAQARTTEVPLARASLAFRGYPRQVDGRTPGDVTFDYQQVSATGPYARHAGAYTRYGDVLPLLSRVEDRFAILGSGDEVALEFDSASLPPLPAGWKRDYFFFAHGYSKDMDFYEAHSSTVEPLPFAAMPAYPYYSGRDGDDGYSGYRLDFNTRQESGLGVRGLRFDYREEK